MKRFLTGVKPTGFAHLGNYFGAIKPAIELSKQKDSECLYFIADYHALTTVESGAEMEEYFYNIACTWLACGLDPEKVIFYRQSDIKEDFELNWILCNVTPKGLMNRAHAYKAMVEKNSENGVDKDDGVNMGLYNYPILMTADIVLFDTDFVPVGFDQKQHVEIARDIVHNFNLKYGKTLKEPNEYIDKNCATLVGLDGRKMSKVTTTPSAFLAQVANLKSRLCALSPTVDCRASRRTKTAPSTNFSNFLQVPTKRKNLKMTSLQGLVGARRKIGFSRLPIGISRRCAKNTTTIWRTRTRWIKFLRTEQ